MPDAQERQRRRHGFWHFHCVFCLRAPAWAGDVNGDGHVNKDDVGVLSKEDAARVLRKEFFGKHYRLNGEVGSRKRRSEI